MTGFSARLVAVLVLLPAGGAPARAQRFAFDPERIFMLGDADLDGRLSLDEFRELYRSFPRMKDAAVTIEQLFRRLDADGDGFLSLAEYRKAFPPRPGGSVVKPDASKEKPAPITPEQEKFFEAKIPPVLVTHCGKCHAQTAEKPRGGLRLDSRRRGHGQNADGRDHNNKGFSVWLAGGGVKRGVAYGQTDELGYEAVENPMHVHDLHATVLHLLGLDHERLTYRYAGRDMRLTDIKGVVHRAILA